VCFVDAGPSPAAATAKASIVLDRESSLKYQTRTVRFFPGGEGIAVGCIEGRVAIEYLSELGVDPPPDANSSGAAPAKKYAFKCHRRGDLVFPVNCVEFHPGSLCTLATGGGDGAAVLWNGLAKRRLSPLMSCPTSVAALAFHPLGTELAVASSYTFERGPLEASPEEGPPPKDEIYLRALLASEFQPKGGGGG
jgi:cell cycle arrest protein BUB3